MEPELPSQRTYFVQLTPQTLGMLKLVKITFGLGVKRHVFQTTVYKDNKKTDIMMKGWGNSGKRKAAWGTCQMQSLKIKVGSSWPRPVTHFWPYGCLLEPKAEEAVHWRLGLGVPPTSPQALVTKESRAVPRSPTIHLYGITASPSVSQETTHPSNSRHQSINATETKWKRLQP